MLASALALVSGVGVGVGLGVINSVGAVVGAGLPPIASDETLRQTITGDHSK